MEKEVRNFRKESRSYFYVSSKTFIPNIDFFLIASHTLLFSQGMYITCNNKAIIQTEKEKGPERKQEVRAQEDFPPLAFEFKGSDLSPSKEALR